MQWLADDLNSSSARCTLAAFHRPRFSSGDEYGDDESVSGLWQALQDDGVDVVLNGHEHSYERFAPQRDSGRATAEEGMAEFVVGTGGRDLRGFGDAKPNSEVRWNSSFGVLALTLQRRPLRLAVPRDGWRGRRSRAARPAADPGNSRAGGWFNLSVTHRGSGSPRSGTRRPHLSRGTSQCAAVSTPTTTRPRSRAAAGTSSPPAAPPASGQIHVEVCSACHPFYTGKQKILDSGGRVARFEARYGKRPARRQVARPTAPTDLRWAPFACL